MCVKTCRPSAAAVSLAALLSGLLPVASGAQVAAQRAHAAISGLVPQALPIHAKAPRAHLDLGKLAKLPGLLPGQRAEQTNTTLKGYIGSGDVMAYFSTINQELSTDPETKFEAQCKDPGVAWLAWQVSSFPFPPRTTDWEHVPGLIDCRVLQDGTKPGYITRFRIDLGLLARVLHRDEAAADANWTTLISLGRPPAGQPHPYRGLMSKVYGKIPQKVPDSGWYYVRVVPLTAKGELAGAPSNAVTLQAAPRGPGPKILPPDQVNQDRTVRPDVIVDEWTPVRFEAFDAQYHVLTVRDFTNPATKQVIIPRGTHLDMTPKSHDDSFWDSLCDAIGGFFNFIEQAVNWVSNAYASIKDVAIDLGCSVLGDWAREGLTMALDTGLAAIGLPPSLPDFDDLQAMGASYLADVASEQVGVPGAGEAATKVVGEMCKQTRAARNAAGDASVWFVPDPDFLFRPARVLVTLRNATGKTTDPLWLSVDTKGMVTSKEWVTDPFKSKKVPVPAMRPGETLRIPIYLDTQLDDPRLYSAYTAEVTALWWQNYNGDNNMRLSVGTYFRPTKQVKKQSSGTVCKTHFDRRITGSKKYQWP